MDLNKLENIYQIIFHIIVLHLYFLKFFWNSLKLHTNDRKV